METATAVEETVVAPPKVRDSAHLKPYWFQPGHAPIRRADGTTGRPKGTKNALTVILDAAPKKAKQYVRSTAPAVLVDARKWIMPIESDAPPAATVNLVQLLTQRYQSPAPLLRAGTYSPPVSAATGAPTLTHETAAATEAATGSHDAHAATVASTVDDFNQRVGAGASPTPPRGE